MLSHEIMPSCEIFAKSCSNHVVLFTTVCTMLISVPHRFHVCASFHSSLCPRPHVIPAPPLDCVVKLPRPTLALFLSRGKVHRYSFQRCASSASSLPLPLPLSRRYVLFSCACASPTAFASSGIHRRSAVSRCPRRRFLRLSPVRCRIAQPPPNASWLIFFASSSPPPPLPPGTPLPAPLPPRLPWALQPPRLAPLTLSWNGLRGSTAHAACAVPSVPPPWYVVRFLLRPNVS
jgi:hypothetical protein